MSFVRMNVILVALLSGVTALELTEKNWVVHLESA